MHILCILSNRGSFSVSFIVLSCEVKHCLVSLSVVENREQFLAGRVTILARKYPLTPAVTVIVSLVRPNFSFSAAFVKSQVLSFLLIYLLFTFYHVMFDWDYFFRLFACKPWQEQLSKRPRENTNKASFKQVKYHRIKAFSKGCSPSKMLCKNSHLPSVL